MPQKIVCEKCGYVFYYGEDLVVPEDLLRQNDYQCPGCGRKLNSSTYTITIAARGERGRSST
ncbi:hypothetical protein KEJ19_02685 [Candidatus Bathyarchaeota archaeon]|nr:hypothetical protein [Candidatus Bathyarchaeota archaeon]